MRRSLAILFLFLAGCATTAPVPVPEATRSKPAPISLAEARQRLAPVKARVEPVAERECRARTRAGTPCDYLIAVDERLDLPANAYQTVDRSGRPLIIFTAALIAETRNADELAFVMGHEAAHHTAGHLSRSQEDALAGAALGAILVALGGGNAQAIEAAADLGGEIGARSFSKEYELEADALGTVIAHKAGYDPLHGAQYFNRVPDPGNRFLGTHPPNAARMEIVRRTVEEL